MHDAVAFDAERPELCSSQPLSSHRLDWISPELSHFQYSLNSRRRVALLLHPCAALLARRFRAAMTNPRSDLNIGRL
jgi:hypothetical protein